MPDCLTGRPINEILKILTNNIELLALIAMETNNGVTIFDSCTGNTLWVNEGFTRFTGYTLQDLQGKEQGSVLSGSDTDSATLDYIKSQIESKMPYCCDVLIYAKSGEAKWQSLNGQLMRPEGAGTGKYFSISTDISERLRMEEEKIAEKVERQKELTRIILQAQETERNKLGRELHDNLNQMLASVNLQLGYYLEQPENNSEIVENCRRILQKIIHDARNISHHMVMPHFTDRGLKEELELLVEHYSYKKIVQVDLLSMREKDIPAAIKDTVYRIAQAQLSNIHKHARARKIFLQVRTDSRHLTMVILDNGIGFDPLQRREGLGISNIFSRVESYNGTADIDSRPGKGCTLSVTIPLPYTDRD
jgi:PAS domain S-box-containing protein